MNLDTLRMERTAQASENWSNFGSNRDACFPFRPAHEYVISFAHNVILKRDPPRVRQKQLFPTAIEPF